VTLYAEQELHLLPEKMIYDAAFIVETWLPRYPSVRPWVVGEARATLRRSEDVWLARFTDLDSLTRAQVEELIDWKWQGYRPQRSRAIQGADRNWDHASGRIARALAEANAGTAIDTLRGPTGGIPNWQTAMASVVLAACRPERYTIADSRALRTMMLLEDEPSHAINNTRYFPRFRWESYLGICHELGRVLRVPLRDLDRAFWAAAGQRAPAP
jgi:hypothetical protein